MFAHVEGGTVTEWGPLPFSARRQDTGRVVHDLPGTGAKWRRACGWFEVIETPAPTEVGYWDTEPDLITGEPIPVWRTRPLTVDEIAVWTVELVDGAPTQVWTVRTKTADELAEETREANRDELAALDRLRAALLANKQWLERTSAPTNAQVIAHIDRLTKQMSALLRLVGAALHAELLDEIDDSLPEALRP